MNHQMDQPMDHPQRPKPSSSLTTALARIGALAEQLEAEHPGPLIQI